jgi:hypothetical protein
MPRWNFESLADRFWSKVEKTDGCWIWKAGRSVGYGSFLYGGKCTTAHRVAWILTFGDIAEDVVVCHKCDNPPCVRPDHLFIGTDKDNSDDKIQKGRQGRAFGSRNANHRLTFAKAQEMRSLYATGEWSIAKLAEAFGVSKKPAWQVVHNVTWLHDC